MRPPLLAPLPTPAEMNVWDAQSGECYGLSTEILMENASREALHALAEVFGDVRGRRALLLAGPGNNGGDAVALARHLHDAGASVLLLLARPAEAYQGASGFHLRLARKVGVPVANLEEFDLTRGLSPGLAPDLVVDGLLGTGLSGEPRPQFAAWIEAVNALGEHAFVFSLDIPSGLSGLTGRPAKATVRARATVTFEAAKLGLALPRAKAYVGRLLVRPIGIPRLVREDNPPTHYLLTEALRGLLAAPRADMHKGSAGRILILGGSPGLTGAPALCALAALRAGAGLVTVACPKGIEPTLKAGLPDVMTLPLGHGEDWSADLAAQVAERLETVDALAVGPGIGRSAGARAFLDALTAPSVSLPPAVWDADALNWLADQPDPAARLGGNGTVLTPHPGEMARLLGTTIQDVEADRFEAARALARRAKATALLKGPGTVLCADGPGPMAAMVSPFAEPNLAVGGSGDVLSGVIAALLGQGISPLPAACLGVYWHGLAGRLASVDFPHRGNLASEIAGLLPRAATEWLHHAQS
ncbi:hypothetical protein JCM15519_00730 [Fundidesulfovibrio butyratiphilus]